MDSQIFQILVIIRRVKSWEDRAATKVRNHPRARLLLINRTKQNLKELTRKWSDPPVVFLGVLHGALFELLVHPPVEVVPQEERPEPEEGVHLLRLADATPLPLCNTELP